jgi:hypothetical protein
MKAGKHRSDTPESPRRPGARPLCVAIAICALACALPISAGATEPSPPGVGGGSAHNLSIGTYWGLYEERESDVQDSIAFVGAPMPFEMQLLDNGEDRLFVFVQHRLPGGPYCAETPAQLEHVSVALTASGGDPTMAGPAYRQTYLWTPTEAGEYALCAYLDTAPTNHPTAINFLKLTADPAPGQLSLAVTPDALNPEHSTVNVQGTAVVPSVVTASVQEQGQPCTLPEGRLAGQQLAELPGSELPAANAGAVAQGSFSISFGFTAAKAGDYEACAYITPVSTERMYSWRPYEVGGADFSLQELPPSPEQGPPAVPQPPQLPTLSSVRMTNTRFRVATGVARSARRAPPGTTFRFAVSASATVTIAIARLLPGLMREGICTNLPSTAVPGRARRCTRSIAVGSIVRPRVSAGMGAVPFTGVVGQRKLAAGSYAAALAAANSSGRSGSVRLQFNVTR